MIKSLYLLTKLQICNFFALNEARFSRDPKKRKSVQAMLIAYLILGVVLVFYSAGLTFALNEFGLGQVTPTYLGLLSVGLCLGLTFLKAGSLFDIKSYEKLAVLPVPNAVVVASRFLSLYIANFLFTFAITASGGITYGILSSQGVWFYLSMILSSVFLPLLPMTLALTLGAVLYAILSRFKGNNFTKTIFTCIFVIACLAFPTMVQEQSDAEFIGEIATLIQNIGGFVLPLSWLAKGVYLSGIGYYFLFVSVSVLVFALFSWVVGKFYKRICSGLSASVTKGKYSVGEMKAQTALKAFYKRELKGYVSSSLYFMNTIIGNAIAVFFAIFICFTDVNATFAGFFGVSLDPALLKLIIPCLFALMIAITPSTSCAISMEGKRWDLTKSMPVDAKTVMNAKLLTCLTFSLPCALIGEIALWIGLRSTGVALLVALVTPITVALFSAVSGLFINVKFPLLNWDNEAQAVKQSTSVLLSMLAGLIAGGFPIVLSFLVPSEFFVWVWVGYIVLLAGMGVVFYRKITSISLNHIDKK